MFLRTVGQKRKTHRSMASLNETFSFKPPASLDNSLQPIVTSTNRPPGPPMKKIVAITDTNYVPIALDWHHCLISLGYASSQVIVVAADDASLQYFNSSNSTNVTVEPMLHPSSPGWPVADPKLKQQQRCRQLFATRWIYLSHQLRSGHSVLLTNADNTFVRGLDTVELEKSGYDVFHAYCHNFLIRFLSMGFVVCSGMMWLHGNDGEKDRPAVEYVESILERCHWHYVLKVHSSPLMVEAASCDDQQVISSKFFSNLFNYTWDKRPGEGFWRSEAWGESMVTGHKFAFWSVDVVYRGPVDGYSDGHDPDGNSSTNGTNATVTKQYTNLATSWVTMPYNTIPNGDTMDPLTERVLHVKQWYGFCRNEMNITTYVGNL